MGWLGLLLIPVALFFVTKGSSPTLLTPGIWNGIDDEGKRQVVAILQALGVDPTTGSLIPGYKVSVDAINVAYEMEIALADKGFIQASHVVRNYARQREIELQRKVSGI